VWDPTSFRKNRERLQQGKVFDKFMAMLLEQPKVKPLLSDEHFSLDGTLIGVGLAQELQAQGCRQRRRRLQLPWPSAQERHSCLDQRSDAKLYRKAVGREARLSYLGHVVMENRNGLAVAGKVSQGDGTAERRASEALLKRKAKRRRTT
jgi:hypothetical protein